jgi:hypothetical protein
VEAFRFPSFSISRFSIRQRPFHSAISPRAEGAGLGVHAVLASQGRDHVAPDEVAKLRGAREHAPGWRWVPNVFFSPPSRLRDWRNRPASTAFPHFLWDGCGKENNMDNRINMKWKNNWLIYTTVALAFAAALAYILYSSLGATPAPSDQFDPKVAYLDLGSGGQGVYLAVWTDQRSGANDIVGATVKPRDKTTLPTNFPLTIANGSQTHPAVAANTQTKEFLAVWEDERTSADADIYGQLVQADGTLRNPNFKVTQTSGSHRNPAVACNSTNNQYFVVWEDQSNKGYMPIYGRFLDKNGAPLGANFCVTDPGVYVDCLRPSLAYNANKNEFLLVWEDWTDPLNINICGQRVDVTTGTILGSKITISTANYNQKYPKIAYNALDNIYLVAWEDYRNPLTGPDIYGQFVEANGTLSGANFAVGVASGHQGAPSLASGVHEFMVTFDDGRNLKTTLSDIYAQRVSSASGSLQVQGSNFPVCNQGSEQAQNSLAFAAGDNSYLVVFKDGRNMKTKGSDIYGQNFDVDGKMLITSSQDNIIISVHAVKNPLVKTSP